MRACYGLVPRYEYRARAYPWAAECLRRAEAVHGAPPREPEGDDLLAPGFCQCGCGERTPLAARTDARYGRVKGQPARYLAGHNSRMAPGKGT